MGVDKRVLRILCPQCKKPMIKHDMEQALLCTYMMTAVMFNMKMLDKLKEGGGHPEGVDWDSLDKHGV